jgi:hypothetical protein
MALHRKSISDSYYLKIQEKRLARALEEGNLEEQKSAKESIDLYIANCEKNNGVGTTGILIKIH